MTTLVDQNGIPLFPSGYRVRGQSYKSLELLAEKFRMLLPKEKGNAESIDCSKLIRQIFEKKLDYGFFVAEEEKIKELAAFVVPDEKLLVMRSDIYEKLEGGHPFGRSTAVHELSHTLLNHSAVLCRGRLEQHQFYEDSEWQAKALTAAIMMPLKTCQRLDDPSDIADLCGTSVQAATYRLEKLRNVNFYKR